MFTKEECYRARSELTAFRVLDDNTLAFSTQLHGVKIYSHKECLSLKNIALELLSHKTTAVAFSQNLNILAFANSNMLYIVDTKTKLLLQTIKTYEGEITLIDFVPNTKYIITGTSNGRVMQYRYDGRTHLSRLCSFGHSLEGKRKHNYVSAFAFKDDTLASSGYGGEISILKMNSYTQRYIIKSSKVRINVLSFLDDEKIISGNIDGLIHIHSLKTYQLAKTIAMPFTNINSIVSMPNKDFIMVSGEAKELILINLKSFKIVNSAYLTFRENVTKILLTHDKHLLVQLSHRTIHKVEMPTAQHLKVHLLHNNIDKAYELIEKDPMLQGTCEHKRVEVMYKKLYAQAVEELIQGKTNDAKKLMKMFSTIKSKKEDIASIFKAFKHYPRFKTLYLEKKYALAYAIAANHPALKHTNQFKKMEETFKETFSFAQKQILIGRLDVAKEILSPYATVISKKPILNLVLKNNSDFIEFLQAVYAKEYATIEKLVQENEIFRQIPTYVALQNDIQKSLHNIRKELNTRQTQSAIAKIKELLEVKSIKDDLQDLYRDAKIVDTLHEKYEAHQFVACYELLDNCKSISSIELAVLLEKHWSMLMSESEEFALKGDFKSIKKTLGELIAVKTRVDKIGDLIRLSFQVKIKGFMAKRNFKGAENIIYSYMDILGKDSELLIIMRTYENISKTKLALSTEQDSFIPRDNWRNSSLIME